jgi:TorA maturation chaperone TorD
MTTELLELVQKLDVPDTEAGAAATELQRMQDAIESLGGPDTAAEALNQEATRLFEGPGKPMAPPFASFYLNGETLMGPETGAVRRAYLDAGFLPDPSVHLPPDHLSLELGFLGALADRSAVVDATDAATARRSWWDFIANHLAPWLGRWHEDLRRANAHPFYLGLAGFVGEIVDADLAWLDESSEGLGVLALTTSE